MENQELIVEGYKKMFTGELLYLAKNPSDLQREAIVLLQKELLSRHLTEEALSLTNYLAGLQASIPPPSSIQDEIRSRIESGEPIESIRIDLEERGYDLSDIGGEHKTIDSKLEYMVYLQEQNLSKEEVNAKMELQFGDTASETELLRAKLKSKSTANKAVGFTLIIASALLITVALGNGARLGLGAILIPGLGVALVVKGLKQEKAA